ncbi:MAG TPA: NF038122 family metalloprotease [Bryobacteraceae bacterium]|nr:NF038122 family metalloprotease [Bryobacteraceae bacterium]
MHRFRRLPNLTRFVLSLGLSLAGVLLCAPSAKANIVIVPTFDSSITGDANALLIETTINQALNFYETNITTPITVHITYAEMGSGLGQSDTFFDTVSYSQYLSALQAHSSGNAVDTSALGTLPAGPNDPVDGTTNVDVTTANLRALGFSASAATDSTISVNTAITNYAGKPFNGGFYSLLAVIEHETDEALGLGSNLDTGSNTGSIRPEDLFRYSAPGTRSYTIDSGATSYFSVDGGVTNLAGFNQTGPPGGADYGDWASSGTPRVQDAFGTPGAFPVFGPEQAALDAIGYNFASLDTPEPSSWLLMLGGIGFFARRRFFTRAGR